jgi:hypothetical protein
MCSGRIMSAKKPGRRVIAALADFFRRNGYVRRQNAGRLSREGYRRYKKGDEIRLCARSARELTEIRRLLKLAGFKPGRPFLKGRCYRQPVYRREAVRCFLELVGANKDAHPDGAVDESRPIHAPTDRA